MVTYCKYASDAMDNLWNDRCNARYYNISNGASIADLADGSCFSLLYLRIHKRDISIWTRLVAYMTSNESVSEEQLVVYMTSDESVRTQLVVYMTSDESVSEDMA